MFKEFKKESQEIMFHADRIVLTVVLALIALWILSGIYIIEANQVGLVRRFGANLPGLVQPGIHYRLPWPVDRIDKINTREVKGMDVGFFLEEGMDPYGILLPYCITGDMNIIHNRYIIQYRISEPAKYKFLQTNPEQLLQEIAQTTIIKSIGARSVDPILTTTKREVAEEVRANLQSEVDSANLGVTIVSIDTKMVSPPESVKKSFQDVISAQSEKSTAIHQAETEKNKIIPLANSKANEMKEAARAYKFERKSRAEGEAKSFLKLLTEYKSSPQVTSDRLYLQMIEKILPGVKVIVLATDSRGKPVKLKLFSGPMPTQPIIPELGGDSGLYD
jgi:membrane protease subunit HflK